MTKIFYWGFVITLIGACGCKSQKKQYLSNCNENVKFQKVTLPHLMDSARFYNKQYVEVTGKYIEGKNVSALVNDSLFATQNNSRSLWVNFIQDCPLYLSGTQQGLFSSADGAYGKLNNRLVTIRGRVETNSKGFRATINEVSYIALY